MADKKTPKDNIKRGNRKPDQETIDSTTTTESPAEADAATADELNERPANDGTAVETADESQVGKEDAAEPDNWAALKYHPAADLFPLMQGEEYEAFREDIGKRGPRESIVLYDGMILDGRNRHRVCIDLGIKPRFRKWDGPGSPLEYVISANWARRQLTSSQRAAIAVDVEARLAADTKGRRKRAATEIFPAEPGEARELAARLCGTNPHYVTDLKKIKDKAPDLFEQVRNGELTVPQAQQRLDKRRGKTKPERPKGKTKRWTVKTLPKHLQDTADFLSGLTGLREKPRVAEAVGKLDDDRRSDLLKDLKGAQTSLAKVIELLDTPGGSAAA
jgi:hypothetical protein